MFFKYIRGKLFENGKRYAKSETTLQKALVERIPNHILHVQFERKTSVSQSNLLYPLYGVYVYNYPKRQKMPKRVKYVYFEMAPKAMTLHNTSYLFTPMHLVCPEEFFLSRTSLPEPILSGEGGGNFQLFPLLRPPCILTGPNWHMHNLAMGPTI